ncbi:hypothetical protein [Marinobacter sp.]|uniref:hypothetical protein n=1 Tax=Marinobacter sp. TaxID=50741 RepID=UPI00384AFA60
MDLDTGSRTIARPVWQRLFLPGLALAGLLALSACGGDDAIDLAKASKNSFPPAKNPIDDFSETSTGDSSNSVGLAANQVRVTMEVPGSLAPDGELTRRNLRIVEPDQVRVYRTSNRLQELGSVNDARQVRRENKRVVIEFGSGQPLGPDVVVEASFGNAVFRAFASDSDRDIKANPFSEYLVENALGGYTDSQFDQVMDCVNSDNGDNLCLNKFVWSTLSDQIQDFEIDIPSGVGVNGSLSVLNERADFANYVSAMADFALLDAASSGKIAAQSADYNSVFLGIELGQSFLVSSTQAPGQWGTRVAREEFLQDDLGTAFVYPGLTLASFDIFNIRITSLATDIPYVRATVAQTSANEFFPRLSDFWDLNTQSTSPGAATVADDLRLLAGRSLFQSVTGLGSSRTIGWTRNPFFLDAYVGGGSEDPDRVLNGYFSAGKAIELTSRAGELKREQTLENHYLSALDFNLARSSSSPEDFDLTQMDGESYNLVSFAVRLGAENEPVRVESGVGTWLVSGQTAHQSMSDTQTITRDDTGGVTPGDVDRSGARVLSNRTSQLSSGDVNMGRLNLHTDANLDSGERPQFGVGASTPDASLLAFNLDNTTNGDGLLVAARQTATLPTSGSYRVQGLTMGLSTDVNRLSHFAGASLTLTGAATARLETKGFEVVHTVSQESVSRPGAMAEQTIDMIYADLDEGRVSFKSGDLVLQGFVSADQEQMVLRVTDQRDGEQTLGLVLATLLP